MSNYDHVAAIFDLAREKGYKVLNFKTEPRTSEIGAYEYVTLNLLVPVEEPKTTKKEEV